MYRVVSAVLVGLLAESSFAQTLPELPRQYVDTTMPTTTVTKTVCESGCDYRNSQFQQAIDEAVPGTTIMLEPGAVYAAPADDRGFVLKKKSNAAAGWIVIRTASPDHTFPAADGRISPAYEAVLPKIERRGVYAVTCESGASRYRLIGIEFKHPADGGNRFPMGAFIACGRFERRLEDQPSWIIFDRLYAHGAREMGQDTRFGIQLQGRYQAVINSYIEDVKIHGFDAIGIVGFLGQGPFKIVNNHVESSTENIHFGGVDPLVQNVTPSDIEIRRNYITKPLRWRDDISYKGLLVKNLLELKHAMRVVIDGNVFENSWPGGQPGFALTITPRQQDRTAETWPCKNDIGCAPWTLVGDLTVSNNVFKNVPNGIALSGRDPGVVGPPVWLAPTQRGARFWIKNNVFVQASGYPGTGVMFQLANGPEDVTIEHNTAAHYNDTNTSGIGLRIIGNESTDPVKRLMFRGNIFLARAYPFFAGGGCTISSLGRTVQGLSWTTNVIAGPWPSLGGCKEGMMPVSNIDKAFPASEAIINYADVAAMNFGLAADSSYKNKAFDGKDVGVIWRELQAALGNAINWKTEATTRKLEPPMLQLQK